MIAQHGVWFVVAVIAIGWMVSLVSALGRASRRLAATGVLPVSLPDVSFQPAAPALAAAPPQRPQRPQAARTPPAAAGSPAPAASRQGLAVLLRDGAGLRSGVVLAEVLAPPVSLR